MPARERGGNEDLIGEGDRCGDGDLLETAETVAVGGAGDAT